MVVAAAWPVLRRPLGCSPGRDPFALQLLVPLAVQWGLRLLPATPPEFVGSLVLGLVATQLVVLELGAGLALGALCADDQDRIVALTTLGTAAAMACHVIGNQLHVHRVLACAMNADGAWAVADQRQCRDATLLWTVFAAGVWAAVAARPVCCTPRTAPAILVMAACAAVVSTATACADVQRAAVVACAGVGWGVVLQRTVRHARNAKNKP